MRHEPPKIDWNRLRDLRDRFLDPEPITEPYWTSNRLLKDYDCTLGARIGWKWDAVIEELKVKGWRPPSPFLTDIGCGTGIAARRMIAAFPGGFQQVTLWDHSPQAMTYAKQKLRHEAPEVKVVLAKSPGPAQGIALISHVLTEMTDEAASELLEQLEPAQAVVWVEPGTYATSRMLIEAREALRDRFTVRAPCTHQAGCGLLTEENAAHWCHHFAPAPPGAHQDPFWGHFRREMNLDIGPLAYSFLVLDRSPASAPADNAHIIGKSMRFPKFIRVLACREEGVQEFVAGRKSDVYKELKRDRSPALYELSIKQNRIQSGRWLGHP
jgi:SAM-dependent methyltransferase